MAFSRMLLVLSFCAATIIAMPAWKPAYARHAHRVDDIPYKKEASRHSPRSIGVPLYFSNTTTGLRYEDASSGSVFDGKCRYLTLQGHGRIGKATLEGECVDRAGQWWRTSLSLNKCVGQRNGHLLYETSGNFDVFCRPCTVEEVDDNGSKDMLLQCNCVDRKGVPKYTEIQMGLRVEHALAVRPENGRLVCGEYIGDGSPILDNEPE